MSDGQRCFDFHHQRKMASMARLKAVAQLIQRCRSHIEAAGFTLKGAAATRDLGPLLHGIAVRASRNYPGRFLISLDVTVFDPFLAKPDHVVCLRGYVGRDGASHRQIWWESIEVEQAAANLLAHAIPWLDKRGDVPSLIAIFEGGIESKRSFEDTHQWQGSNETADSIVRALWPSGLQQAFPFIYHHWLSLLYYHAVPQQISRALAHAKEYCKYVPAEESETTLHRLAAMDAHGPC